MEFARCNVQVLRSPYEVIGMQPYQPRDKGGVSSKEPSPRENDQRLSMPDVCDTTQLPAGPRGALQVPAMASLVLQHSCTSPPQRGERLPLRMITRHKRGQMLVWDCNTLQLIGSCSHGVGVSVAQVIHAGSRFFTRVECDASSETDCNVFVWSATTFTVQHVLRGHEGRVTALAVDAHDPQLVISAGLDHYIFIWDLARTAKEPIHRLRTENKGSITGVITCGAYTLAAGSDVTLEVWETRTGRPLGRSAANYSGAVSVCRWYVLNASSAGSMHHTSSLGGGLSTLTNYTATMPRRQQGFTSAASATDTNGRRKAGNGAGDGEIAPLMMNVFTAMTDGSVSEWSVATRDVTSAELAEEVEGVGDGYKTGAGEPPSPRGSERRVRIHEVWHSKSHRALISDVVADNEVVASFSLFDGVCVYHRATGLVTRRMESEGCCAMRLDAVNKRLLLGSSKGQLVVLDYAGFAAGATRELVPLWSCHPHTAAITDMHLEFAQGNIWERLFTCSVDSTVTLFDLNALRHLRLTNALNADLLAPMDRVTLPSAASTPTTTTTTRAVMSSSSDVYGISALASMRGRSASGSSNTVCSAVAMASTTGEDGAKVCFFGAGTLQPCQAASLPTLSGLEGGVTALRWCDEAQTLVVALTGGIVHGYRLADRNAAPATTARVSWSSHFSWSADRHTVLHISEPCGSLVSLCLVPSAGSSGPRSLVVLNVESGEQVTAVHPLRARATTVRSHLVRGDASAVGGVPYFVLTQEDDGTVQLLRQREEKGFVTGESPYAMELQDGELLFPALTHFHGDTTESSPPPLVVHPTTLFAHGEERAFVVHCLDDGKLLRMSCSAAGVLHTMDPIKLLADAAPAAAVSPGALPTMVPFCVVQQGGIEVAVTRGGSHHGGTEQSPEVELWVREGTAGYVVTYDGCVQRLLEPQPRQSLVSYVKDTNASNTGPSITALAGRRSVSSKDMTSNSATVVVTRVTCCGIAFNAAARYLVFYYSDGLLQLFDTTTKTVFARVWLPIKQPDQISCLWALKEAVVLQYSGGDLISYKLLPRVILDDMNDAI